MQNPNESKRQLKIKLARALPEDISTALASVENAKKIEAIGKKYGLDITKTGGVATEIGEYVLGITPYGALPQNIKNRTGVALDLAQKMVNEILANVFGEIKISLQKHLLNLKNTQPLKNAPLAEVPVYEEPLELTAPAPNPDFFFPRPAAGTPLPPDPTPMVTPEMIKPQTPPPQPAMEIIRTLKTDVAKSEAQKVEDQKRITSIPKQTTVRVIPQIDPSTGSYKKDPYREQI